MTTHDEPTLTDTSDEPAVAVSESPSTLDGDTTASVAENPVESPIREASSADILFADEELADLRERWAGVQAAFVDDPKDCVQKADGLVSDLVEQLTHGFSDARSRLEQQWSRGEKASTEDLRLTLMHYRAFFERLLSA
jgi:hypothetical protein